MRCFFLCFALVFLAIVARPAAAQIPVASDAARETLRQTVAAVDMQLLMRESAAAKSIQEQLEKQHGTYQKQISSQENSLRDAEKELAKQRTILEPDAYNKKRKEFESKIGSVQKDVQGKKRALEAAYGRGLETVQKKVLSIVAKIAEERRLMLVVPSAQLVLVESSMDITQEVLQKLNEQLPSVQIEVKEKDDKDKDAAKKP